MYGRTKAKIDTVEIMTTKNNINDDDLRKYRGYDEEATNKCVSKVRYLADDKVSIIIHPSRYNSRYDDFNSYTEYKKRMDTIIQAIFKDITLLKLKRVDVCVDYTEEFNEQLQLNYSLLECVNREFKSNKKYIQIIDLNDLKTSNLKWSNDRSFTVSIYDKRKESKGLHDYNTRVEYRLFYSNKNYYEDVELECIECLWDTLGRIKHESNYNKAKDKVAERLLQEAITTNNFTSFMMFRQMYLFDDDIIKKLYKFKGKTERQATKLISYNKNKYDLTTIKYINLKQYIEEQIQMIKIFAKS